MVTDPNALLEQARAKLAEMHEVAEENLRLARAAMGGGRPITRREKRDYAHAVQLCRYVADCVQRAAWDPPVRRKRRGFSFGGWSEAPATDHEREAATLLRELKLPKEGETLAIPGDWRKRAVAWLELDQGQNETPKEAAYEEARERREAEAGND